jgi:filamentous hemagglutinin family protein
MKTIRITRKIFAALTAFSMIMLSAPVQVYALPEEPTVQSGDVDFSNPDSNTLDVNQATEDAIIDWFSFSIGVGETVNFLQPGSSSIAMNNVTGGSISEILGTLNANGCVWILNPVGVIFGPSASVNAAGLLASTLSISNNNFLDKAYVFTKSSDARGYIINQGQIAVEDGGYVTLLGESVKNEGIIQAKLGKAILASGEKMTLELDADGVISVAIEGSVSEILTDSSGEKIEDAVSNTGTITADGGTVILTASVLADIFENAVNNEGLIEAGSLIARSGEVYLLAEGANAFASNTGTIDVSSLEVGADGGFVEISGDRIHVDGNIDVTSESGNSGTLLIDPVNLYIVDGPGPWPNSIVGETWLESYIGNLTMDADNNVYFLLSDNELGLQTSAGDTFRVEAGNDINLNDDSIVTSGGNVELLSNVFALDPINTGDGDVLLGVGDGIVTNGGNVNLSGVNVNISAPINTSTGGSIVVAASNDVTHAGRSVITTAGGSYTGTAGGDYVFRNGATSDTPFTVTAGGSVITGFPYIQSEYIFSWEYLSDSRDYRFKEFGYYYDAGGLVHVPLVQGFDIGKDGTPLLNGAGIIYGEDFVSLELYTTFESGGGIQGPYYQNPALNDAGLDHVHIIGNRYEWEDIVNLGDKDFNDAVMNFSYVMNSYPPIIPPPPSSTAGGPLGYFGDELRFKIPRKFLVDTFDITYTHGPIQLTSGQVFFYHPLFEMSMFEMPPLDINAYEFIDGIISTPNPALLPLLTPVLTEEEI